MSLKSIEPLSTLSTYQHKGPSKRCKTTYNWKPVSEDNNGTSMSEKCLGKQKATESEDEIKEDFENNSD